MSKDTPRPAPESPPAPALPPRQRTLLGSAWQDAALGIAASVLATLVIGQGTLACAGGGWPGRASRSS